MRFQTYFKRGVGGTSADPAFSVDGDPSFGDPPPDDGHDSALYVATQRSGIGNPVRRIAVGYRFDGGGAGTGKDAPVKLWAFDRRSMQWYLAASGTLKDGELTYLKCPALSDPPQTSGNMNVPTAGGGEFLIVVTEPASADNGTYHFVAGPDLADY